LALVLLDSEKQTGELWRKPRDDDIRAADAEPHADLPLHVALNGRGVEHACG
jgi:hypothetical protein